jgi:hypothetical protein
MQKYMVCAYECVMEYMCVYVNVCTCLDVCAYEYMCVRICVFVYTYVGTCVTCVCKLPAAVAVCGSPISFPSCSVSVSVIVPSLIALDMFSSPQLQCLS